MRESGDWQAFSGWMRTGRWAGGRSVQRIETKYNHWHDPNDGRFTTAGSGKHDGSWGGGGFTGGGGGGFGGAGAGAGASGDWGGSTTPRGARPKAKRPSEKPAGILFVPRLTVSTKPLVPAAKPAIPVAKPVAPKPLRHVLRNGYDFEIDDANRTRRVSGDITVAPAPSRSRASQAQAGGSHRRPSDDGGHYIAARFNGPKEAFNHFAQNANFNRGGYRVLEAEWAKAASKGAKIHVEITPEYEGGSERPAAIDVVFKINGHTRTREFLNERQGKPHGK